MALLAVALPAWSQEQPLQLSGEVVTGYATTGSKNGSDVSRSISPLELSFDLSTYLGHPDFLSIRAQPRLNLGGDAPQAGFDGRDGILLRTIFLRRRPFPLTVTYSNFRTDSISYGSLVGLNAVRQKGRYQDLGLNWQLNFSRLPRLVFFYNRNDSESQPDLEFLPATAASSSSYGIRGSKQAWGWDLEGEWSRSRRTNDTASILAPELTTFLFRQKLSQGQITARRQFWTGSSLFLMAGHQAHENRLDDLPLDQSRTFLRAAGLLRFSERWNAQLQAGYDSNVNELFPRPLGLLPPQEAPLFQTGLSTLTIAGQTQYQLTQHWTVHGGLNRTSVENRFAANSAFNGTSWSTNGGVGFNRPFRWGQVSAGYGIGFSRSTTANDTNDSTSLGHSLSMQYRTGSLQSLEVTASSALNLNRVESNIFLTQKNALADVTVGRRLGAYVLRGGLTYQDLRNEDFFDFHSRDWGFRASLENTFFNATYTRHAADGRTQVLAAATNGSVMVLLPGFPLRTVLTSSARQSASVTMRPREKLRVRTTWFQLDQSLAERLQTESDFLDVSVLYRFRLLDFEMGYTTYDENIAGLAGVSRHSFLFRVRRAFRIF